MASFIKRVLRKLVTPVLWDCTSAEYQCGSLAFSQFGEDMLLRYLFNDDYRGFYVEVGAFHPMLLSNTYALYRKGWRGLAIDPNPACGELFARFRPGDAFLPLAVGTDDGTVEMAMFKEAAFNCTSDQMVKVPEDVRRNVTLVRVPIQPLSKILGSKAITKVDFLSVDCEGNDLRVLHSNDWSRWTPSVICVEDHEKDWLRSETAQYLCSLGYSLKFRAGFSSLFTLGHPQAPESAESRGWNCTLS